MGLEVSSEPPFKQKIASQNGLYKGLPENLIAALKPIYERGETYHKCGRLWIQADELGKKVFFLFLIQKLIKDPINSR